MKISYGQCSAKQSAQASQIKYHLHGESHEDGTHDPSGIIPLPDDVLVGLFLPQAGAGQVHLLNLQILLQVSFSIVVTFLVYPVILIAWKPKKVLALHTLCLYFLDKFTRLIFDFDLFEKFTVCNCKNYQKQLKNN